MENNTESELVRNQLYNKKRCKKVYVFDIDGTITNETDGWDYVNRTPKNHVIELIQKLYKTAYIILWTSRLSIDEKVTRAWLRKHNVPYHELKFDKMFFDLYICDKAISVEEINDFFRES